MNLKTPVAIFGFIRPDTTGQVFARVREVRPEKLFLCLDAPRVHKPADVEKCNAVKVIFEKVDWPCEVHRNYADSNMGCRARMASGISWVFEHVEEAILLEDDCVPDITFFRFCAEMLEYYRDDTRVGMIAGHQEHFKPVETYGASYYFDRMGTIWGWATWRRAWRKFDAEMKFWPAIRHQNLLKNVFGEQKYVDAWQKIIERVARGERSSWATAWALTMWREHWLCVHPSCNLVTNVGHGEDSTHTGNTVSPWANLPVMPMAFPIVHPISMIPDVESENIAQNTLYYCSFFKRCWLRLKKMLKHRLLAKYKVC